MGDNRFQNLDPYHSWPVARIDSISLKPGRVQKENQRCFRLFPRDCKDEGFGPGGRHPPGLYLLMGLMLSRLVGHTLGYANGASLIMGAFGGTAAILVVMATVATVSKRDFSGMGKWLFAGALVLIQAMVANIFLQLPALHLTILVLIIAVFSAFILYDVQRVVNGGETNYVSATLAIYLSVYNNFSSLLQLLGIVGGERE
jgi:modulator of FtsH protease